MKICVLGAGALGCAIGGVLAEAGCTVTLVTRNAEHVAAIRRDGLKLVEQKLGITRQLTGVSGKDAVALWYTYTKTGCTEALNKLLAYNREDVENLKVLRDALEVRLSRC